MLNNLLASFLCHADTERPELIIVYLKYYSRGGFCLWKKGAEVVISKRKQKHNKFQSFFDYSESHSCIPSPLWFPKTTANLQNSLCIIINLNMPDRWTWQFYPLVDMATANSSLTKIKFLFQPHLTLKNMDSFVTGNGLVLTDFMQSQYSLVQFKPQ